MTRAPGVVTALSLAVGCAALAGCAARSETLAASPVDKASLRSYKTAAVSIDSEAGAELTKETAALGAEVVQRIKTRRTFEEVRMAGVTENAAGTLLIKATVMKAKKVGTGKRMLLGAFAGRAGLTVDVKLIDAATGKQLGTYVVKGESGGTGFSGGTDDAVTKAAEGIAALVG
jgi:hypothetical protein